MERLFCSTINSKATWRKVEKGERGVQVEAAEKGTMVATVRQEAALEDQ